MKNTRQLKDLISVGKATLKDFETLGIKSIEQLAKSEAKALYIKLCKKTGVTHDICAQDVFACAIAQAKNPKLSKDQCNWWYWSKKRLGRGAKS